MHAGETYAARRNPVDLPKPDRKIELGVVRSCLWMENEPSFDDCCGAPTLPGKPYCEGHHARAWVKPRPRNTESVADTTQIEAVLRNSARLGPRKSVAF
jgi:hypothetical protein